MSKNAERKARRYTKDIDARLAVKSAWPDTITDKSMLNYTRMHRTTKAKLGIGAR